MISIFVGFGDVREDQIHFHFIDGIHVAVGNHCLGNCQKDTVCRESLAIVRNVKLLNRTRGKDRLRLSLIIDQFICCSIAGGGNFQLISSALCQSKSARSGNMIIQTYCQGIQDNISKLTSRIRQTDLECRTRQRCIVFIRKTGRCIIRILILRDTHARKQI